MQFNSLKIVLSNGHTLDYEAAENLGIKLNRIVDDFSTPEKRFGEFSYNFSLPKTKANRIAFGFPDVKGRTRIFIGKQFECKVFIASDILLDGLIELTGFDNNTYRCVFFSKVTQLLDDLKGKKVVDMTSLDTIEWNYENTIINHINSDYTNEDTDFQFIYTFYKTPFQRGASGTDDASSFITAEDNFGYYNNNINTSLPWGNFGKNPFYYTNLPPAFYLVNVVRKMLAESGWSLGGSFFNDEDINKIVIPFTGEPEDYSGSIITGTTKYLNLNKLLPDIGQLDLIKSIVNAFNLYFTIDVSNKQINFETYNTLFANENYYDITEKVDVSSIKVEKPEVETKLLFDSDDGNEFVAGYNRIFDYDKLIANEPNPTYTMCLNTSIRTAIGRPLIDKTYSKNAFENLWNKTTGEKEVKLNFSTANYYSYVIQNDRPLVNNTAYNNAKYGAPSFTVGIPLISEQTPQNNQDRPYAPDSGDTSYCEGNSSSEMVYEGGLKMYYYYGPVAYNLNLTGTTNQPYYNWAYFSISTGGTCNVPTFKKIKLPVASPFKLLSTSEFNSLKSMISDFTLDDKLSEKGAEAHYLLATYFTVGTTGNTHSPTKYSLTLGENSIFPNLYSALHSSKYETLRNGHTLTADMRITPLDWKIMQINTPIKYDNENYRLVSINNYDPVKATAEITLLKKS